MSTIKKPPSYYCIVPCCPNTTNTAPNKLFLSVPKDEKKRETWSKAMKRDSLLSTKTSHKCCEDHFSLEEDLENYWQWKLTGDVKRLHLKKGVVPHIFDCQEINMPPVERKTPVKMKHTVCERHFKEDDVETITSFYKEETGETLTAKLKAPRIKEGAIPDVFPSYPSKSTSTNNARVASKTGLKLSKSKKVKSPKKTVRKTNSQNVTESTTAIKQEPEEPTEEPPTLVIENVLSVNELLSSSGTSCFPENAMPVANPSSKNVDETSVTTKPGMKWKRKIVRSMYTSNSTRKATQAKLHRLAKLSLASRRSKMSQSVTAPSITIKQEPVESADEAPPMVVDNVLSVKELLPSNSSSFHENALLVANPGLTKEDKAAVSNKSERKRKINIVKPVASSSTPSVKQSKLHLLANPPMLSKKISGTKKSSGRSISPTEDTRNATKEIFLSLMNGSGKNPLSGSRTSEKSGDLFDVFAIFIADKLRELNWDKCAVALRSILNIVFKAGQVQQSSDDEEENDLSNSNINSNFPSDED